MVNEQEMLLGLPTPREYLLSQMPPDSVCAEIGVHEGDFSEEILRSGKVREIHLIDPWKHEDGELYERSWYGGLPEGQTAMDRRFEGVRQRFEQEIGFGRVVLHRTTAGDAASRFKDGYFDWVYIDGNHLYQFVKQDLESYEPKVKPGGYITGDDYGVVGWWEDGIRRAVDEFIAQRPGYSLEVAGSQYLIRKDA